MSPFKINLSLKLGIIVFIILTLGFLISQVIWFKYLFPRENFDQIGTLIAIQAIFLSLVGLLIFIIFFLFLIRPIKRLIDGAHHISKGYFDYQIKIASRDEFEDLSRIINILGMLLKEGSQKSEHNISVILSDRNKLNLTLHNIADAVIAVDLNRRIILFNQAAENLTGFSAAEALNIPVNQIIKLENAAVISEEVYCPLKTNDQAHGVYSAKSLKLIGKNEKSVYVDITSTSIASGEDMNVGCIMTFHDVTEQKQLEVMKVDFVSMAAHEFRTPLTSIRGYLQVYIQENEKSFNADQKMLLDRISISVQQLTSLTENLLNVSRIERGAIHIAVQPTDWLSLVTQSVNNLSVRARDKKIELSLTAPTNPIPKVYADQLRIIEVLNNLIANAINYTQPGGEIKVSLELKGSEVITHIVDNGQGIAADAIPHLFSKFYRASGKLEHDVKGTGLGLYITKAIIEMHHGRIWVESELGRGSTFSFSLPIVTN